MTPELQKIAKDVLRKDFGQDIYLSYTKRLAEISVLRGRVADLESALQKIATKFPCECAHYDDICYSCIASDAWNGN